MMSALLSKADMTKPVGPIIKRCLLSASGHLQRTNGDRQVPSSDIQDRCEPQELLYAAKASVCIW